MSQRDGYFLVPFGPVPNAEPPAEPRPDFGLGFAAELRGGVQWSFAGPTDSRPHAELSIPFGLSIDPGAAVCARTRLTGLSPWTHAEPYIDRVAYNGSTCGILDADTPVLLYRTPMREGAWTLAMNWPASNLFGYYRGWPRAVVETIPPLGADESPPIITLRLVRFESWTGVGTGENDGVAYPMRLVIDRGAQGTTTVAEKIRQDSPRVGGGGVTLSGRENPFWTIESSEIAEGMAALDPGYYTLELAIYQGSGRQVFDASCRSFTREILDPNTPPPLGNQSHLGEIRASQGSDYGVFETVRVHVLTVAYVDAPLAFRYGVSSNGQKWRDIDLDGTIRFTPFPVGNRHWYGAHGGEPTAISWNDGGTLVWQDAAYWSLSSVAAAAVVVVDGAPALVYAMRDGSQTIWVRLMRRRGTEDVLIAIGQPPHPSSGSDLLFSTAGPLRLCYVKSATASANAVVQEASVIVPERQVDPETGEPIPPPVNTLGWAVRSNVPLPGADDMEYTDETTTETEGEQSEETGRQTTVEETRDYSGSTSLVTGAYYDPSGTLKIVEVTLSLSGGGSTVRSNSYTDWYSGPECWWYIICSDPTPKGGRTRYRLIDQSTAESGGGSQSLTLTMDGVSIDLRTQSSSSSYDYHTWTSGYYTLYSCPDAGTCAVGSASQPGDHGTTESRSGSLSSTRRTVALLPMAPGLINRILLLVGPVEQVETSSSSSYDSATGLTDQDETSDTENDIGSWDLYLDGKRIAQLAARAPEGDPNTQINHPPSGQDTLMMLHGARSTLVSAAFSARAAWGPKIAAALQSTLFIDGSPHAIEGPPNALAPVTPFLCGNAQQVTHPPIPPGAPAIGVSPHLSSDINSVRTQSGGTALSIDSDLANLASTAASALSAAIQELPDATVRAPGDGYLIALGVDSVSHAAQAWAASTSHRARLMSPIWTRLGVAITDTPRGALVVAAFGT